MDSIKPIYKLLGDKNSDLADLVTRANALKKQNFLLRSCLPEGYSGRCDFVPDSANSITLLVDSSAMATRLQYEAREILSKINKIKGHQGITRFVVKVNPETNASPPIKKGALNKPIPRSDAGSRLMNTLAESTDDEELGKSLQKLAARLTKDL